MLRNIIYISASIIVFFAGVVVYGVALNSREVSLEEAMKKKGIKKLEDIRIHVNRTDYSLKLYSDTIMVKKYKAVFGMNSSKMKTSATDNVTPIGTFKICRKHPNWEFHKLLEINYPTERDAAEALKNGLINKNHFEAIEKAEENNECPPDTTPLGAKFGIHGMGKYNFIFKNLPFVFNWTNGSIAISNENIDELFAVTPVGTKVEITH